MASTLQSASLADCNVTKDEFHSLKRPTNDKDIVILPEDKGRVTVVMDERDYTAKIESLVNEKQAYELLKRDPTVASILRCQSMLLQFDLPCAKTSINKSPYQPPLPTDDLMDLRHLQASSLHLLHQHTDLKYPLCSHKNQEKQFVCRFI